MLIAIIGLANTIGRIILGYVSDKPWINRLWLYNSALTICGIGNLTCNRSIMNWTITKIFVDSHGPQCTLCRLQLSCHIRRSLWRHNRSLRRPHVSCAGRSPRSGQVDERIRTFAAVPRNCFLHRPPYCRQVSTTSWKVFDWIPMFLFLTQVACVTLPIRMTQGFTWPVAWLPSVVNFNLQFLVRFFICAEMNDLIGWFRF